MHSGNLQCANDMLDKCERIYALCDPLFGLGPINLLTYSIFSPRDGFTHFCTNRKVYERKLSREAWLDDVCRNFERHVHFSGFQIGDLVPGFREDYGPYLDQLEKEDAGQVGAFGELKDDGTYHLVLLAGDAANSRQTMLFHQNNAHLIRFFCRKIAPTLTELSQRVTPYRFEAAQQQLIAQRLGHLGQAELDLSELLQALGAEQQLTLRQSQIIYWYLMGKTSEETATILGVTKNTVETHWKRIKRKFDCLRKPQVVSELLRYGSYLPRSV